MFLLVAFRWLEHFRLLHLRPKLNHIPRKQTKLSLLRLQLALYTHISINFNWILSKSSQIYHNHMLLLHFHTLDEPKKSASKDLGAYLKLININDWWPILISDLRSILTNITINKRGECLRIYLIILHSEYFNHTIGVTGGYSCTIKIELTIMDHAFMLCIECCNCLTLLYWSNIQCYQNQYIYYFLPLLVFLSKYFSF